MTRLTDIVTLADQYRVMASIGRDLPAFSETLGIDLGAIAGPLQIDPGCFQDFGALISLDGFCRLLETLAVVSGDEALGLKYGQFIAGGEAGPFSLGLAHAPNFKEMLSFYVKYIHVFTEVDVFNAIIETEQITVEWSYSPLISQCEQYADCEAALVLSRFQRFAGRPVEPLDAQLVRRPPRDKSLHVKTLSRNVTFGADINMIVVPASLLDGDNPSADNVIFDYMVQQCETLAASRPRKKDIITILKEDCIEHMATDNRAIADVARRLGMGERTLQRRLTEIGSGYWDVFDETRNELSKRLLTDTDLPLSDISVKLGYSTQSAYTRAVKRWHGKTPGQLRRQIRSNLRS
ncbi:MAG: helix-turn-helix domain-containing protein [Rhizobiales bacterium]|nr:helix-turn-helix domain-containing protein [Hyphomicrobiales bacterium]